MQHIWKLQGSAVVVTVATVAATVVVHLNGTAARISLYNWICESVCSALRLCICSSSSSCCSSAGQFVSAQQHGGTVWADSGTIAATSAALYYLRQYLGCYPAQSSILGCEYQCVISTGGWSNPGQMCCMIVSFHSCTTPGRRAFVGSSIRVLPKQSCKVIIGFGLLQTACLF